jgi:hypothetical protein
MEKMITCPTCKKIKPDSEFYHNRTNKKGGIRFRSHACKSCEIKRVAKRVYNLRCDLLEYGGNKCVKCGYDKCKEALEFHHREPSGKDYVISKYRSINSRVRRELDKCDLLCSNCHRELHSRERVNSGFYRGFGQHVFRKSPISTSPQ